MVAERGPHSGDGMTTEEEAATVRASRAWAELSGASPGHEIRVLKGPRDDGKSVVLGLGCVGPEEQRVVAKELLFDAARVELAVYRDILPGLPVRGPELIGSVASAYPERVWLFLEEVDGSSFDKTDPNQIAIASRWLAILHSATSHGEFGGLVPAQGPRHYVSLATKALTGIGEVSENPALLPADIGVLLNLSAQLSTILASSDSFADVYSLLPAAMVHGDFKGNNMAFSGPIELANLRVFDWSEAHSGPLAADLWWVDPVAYRDTLNANGLFYDRATIEEWKRFSAVIRCVSAIWWEIPRLRYDWVDRSMRRMSLYEKRLASALVRLGLQGDFAHRAAD